LQAVIKRLVSRLQHITVPAARAAIVWVLGEFQSQPAVAKLAPDALRQLALDFKKEAVAVKNQILNLAVKTSLRQKDGPYVRRPSLVLPLCCVAAHLYSCLGLLC
jgi:AP-3 complex subunit beta